MSASVDQAYKRLLKGDYQWRLQRKTAVTGVKRFRRQSSLVQLAEESPREARLFRIFHEQRSGVSLHLRLNGGGRSQVRTLLRRNSLLTGKITENFMKFEGVFLWDFAW